MGRVIALGVLLLPLVPVAADNAALGQVMAAEYVDADGDRVAFELEGGSINLYGNGDLVMERVTLERTQGNTLVLVAPDGNVAETTIPPGQEDRLESILALLSSVDGVKEKAAGHQDATTGMESVVTTAKAKADDKEVGTLLKWRDIDGDYVEIKREEGGWMSLYGNGQLALEKIYLKSIEGRTLFFRSFPGAGTEHVDGETTIPKGKDDVLERLKAIFDEQVREEVGKQELLLEARQKQEQINARRAEEFIATLRAMNQAQAHEGEQKGARRGRNPGLFIDLGGPKEDMAPAVVSEAARGIVTRDPYRKVLGLNRFNFHPNILVEGGGDVAENWIVLFCYSWWQPCQQIEEPYAQMGAQWQRKLNTALFTQTVRFAQVDCATDRELCNERNVEGFPHVQHYSRGELVNKFIGGQANDELRLAKWLTKRLNGLTPPEPAPAREDDDMSFVTMMKETITALPAQVPGSRLATDLLIIVVVLALNMRAVCSNPSLWLQSKAAEAIDGRFTPRATS